MMKKLFSWRSYCVRRTDKALLLNFILEGLEERGCEIRYASDPGEAPFYIAFETPSGERRGVLAYAFYANTKHTRKRPSDEHRFQIKYGGDLSSSLDVALDPHGVITTIFLGINPKAGIFIAADPAVNTPAPMSRSIFFKEHDVATIQKQFWAAWERDRHRPKTKTRPAFNPEDEDLRTEVLVGGVRSRILDLINLERIAQGLDPGERHLVADKLKERPKPRPKVHALLAELEIETEALLDLIDGASRLKMAVRGWVAEQHLQDHLRKLPEVTDCERLNVEGRPDISLRWKGGPPILIECKNTLRTTYADGSPKLDFQRTRASKGDPCSRYYKTSNFPIVAACLHAVTEEWEFRLALTNELPAHSKCPGRIQNMLAVRAPVFAADAAHVFDRHTEQTSGTTLT